MHSRSLTIEQVLTVLVYAQRMARHEQPHVKQIERIVNTMHL